NTPNYHHAHPIPCVRRWLLRLSRQSAVLRACATGGEQASVGGYLRGDRDGMRRFCVRTKELRPVAADARGDRYRGCANERGWCRSAHAAARVADCPRRDGIRSTGLYRLSDGG